MSSPDPLTVWARFVRTLFFWPAWKQMQLAETDLTHQRLRTTHLDHTLCEKLRFTHHHRPLLPVKHAVETELLGCGYIGWSAR
jgi:hypothetical protein